MFLSSLYGQYAVFTYGFLRLDEPWPYGLVPGLPPYGNTAECTEINKGVYGTLWTLWLWVIIPQIGLLGSKEMYLI